MQLILVMVHIKYVLQAGILNKKKKQKNIWEIDLSMQYIPMQTVRPALTEKLFQKGSIKEEEWNWYVNIMEPVCRIPLHLEIV